MTTEQNAELEWLKEELHNMFATDSYNRLLYDMFLDSDRSSVLDLTSTRRALFFVFDDFEKLLFWGQKNFNMHYDPVTVKIFDLNVVKDVFDFKGAFLETVNSALKTPFSLCVFVSVRCENGFRTLYGAAYVGKETQEYKVKRLSTFGSRCNLTFNCENMGVSNVASTVQPSGLVASDPSVLSDPRSRSGESACGPSSFGYRAMGDLTRRCRSCFRTDVDLFVCKRCNNVFYCGRECQKKDWNDHRTVCKEK
jgi:hypothetical protein